MPSSKRRKLAAHRRAQAVGSADCAASGAFAQAVGSADCAASGLNSVGVGVFFVNTDDGRIATRTQLAEVGVVDDLGKPKLPWHRIQGPSDASTLWYALMRKRERGIFIGSMCIRHSERHASLQERG